MNDPMREFGQYDPMRRFWQILNQPTCSVDEFGELFGISRNPAYEAVKRGDVPSIRLGGRIRVPTAPLKAKLGLVSEGAM
jgi:hypothetical protein